MPDRPVALVTGGARRIGRAICEALADDHDVVIHANSSATEAKALAHTLEAAGGTTGARAWAITADLGKPAEAENLLARAAAAAGRPVQVLVNNASAYPEQGLDAATYADLDTMMRLHAWAPLALTRALAATGVPDACVVNLLDARIHSFDPTHVPYLLSKQLLAEVTRLTAHTYAPGLRVNAVAPGAILPPSSKTGTAADRELERGAQAAPLGRAGTPDEVAAAVRSLVDNPYVTGQVLYVDGGRHLKG